MKLSKCNRIVSKARCGNNKLKAIKSRYREDRACHICVADALSDDYHSLFQRQNQVIISEIIQYISHYYKFNQILSSIYIAYGDY